MPFVAAASSGDFIPPVPLDKENQQRLDQLRTQMAKGVELQAHEWTQLEELSGMEAEFIEYRKTMFKRSAY